MKKSKADKRKAKVKAKKKQAILNERSLSAQLASALEKLCEPVIPEYIDDSNGLDLVGRRIVYQMGFIAWNIAVTGRKELADSAFKNTDLNAGQRCMVRKEIAGLVKRKYTEFPNLRTAIRDISVSLVNGTPCLKVRSGDTFPELPMPDQSEEHNEILTKENLFPVLDLLDSLKMRYWVDGGWDKNVFWKELGTTRLSAKYLPIYEHPFKQKIYQKALKKFQEAPSPLFRVPDVHRYCYANPPHFSYMGMSDIKNVPYFFRYDDSGNHEDSIWYLNFADTHLFAAYDAELFAQDEIQTLEHPMLGGFLRFLTEEKIDGLSPRTVEKGVPTPILFTCVPRWIHVNTTVADESGRTRSIYGNAFADAPEPLLEKAITVCETQTLTNILAMAAPIPGRGEYKREEITQMLHTVLTGFGAAVALSEDKRTIIHTGRWGAGAFGGSEELSLLIQILCGAVTGVKELIFHAVSSEKLEQAQRYANEAISKNLNTIQALTDDIHALHYHWGKSDGN